VANTRSARKRIKTSEKRRLRNRAVRSQVRSQVRTARAVEPTQGAEGRAAIQDAIRSLDKAVSRGVIHRNTAARRKSSLARRLALVK
jgi:small subunit ribosomal protein S20